MPGFAAIIKILARPGARADLAGALSDYIDDIEHEDGTTHYIRAEDPELLWLYESYAEDPALEHHLGSDAYRDMSRAINSLLAEPPQLTRLREVKSKGR
jgi:quinol monooxygenase YgiN